MCRIHALLMELTPGGVATHVTVTKAHQVLEALEPADAMARYRVELCRELVADMARYDAQMKASKQRIRAAVTASATSLEQVYGCGPICAAMIIGHAGAIARFKSRSHFASYNATAPIEASSGSKQRHRLNPRRNRQLNWAIHMIAVTQLRNPTTPGRGYFDRKVAEARPTKKRSELSSDGSPTSSTGTSLQMPNDPATPDNGGFGRTPRNDSDSSVTGSTS